MKTNQQISPQQWNMSDSLLLELQIGY